MGDYVRSTRACDWSSLHTQLRAVIEAHCEKYELGNIFENALACCETRNEKQKKGLLGGPKDPDKEHFVAALVAPGWFIWARYGEKAGAATLTARLDAIEVRDYAYAHMIEDNGLHVLGQWTDAIERSEVFLGLGPERAAQDFAAALKQAVADAHA